MTQILERIERVADHLIVVGQRDRVSGAHASDAALWAIARAFDRDNEPEGPELIGRDVDVDLLGQMRHMYVAGRDPELVSA